MHPALSGGPHARVLILGGGDGLAAREALRHGGVRRVDVVELDPGLIRLARHDPGLTAANGHVYDDPRVRTVTADALGWLRGAPAAAYDVVIADLPDPGITASTKLYSQEFYGLARRVLAPGGKLVVHAGSVTTRPRVFWTVAATLRAMRLRPSSPYRVVGHDSGFPSKPRPLGGRVRRPARLGLPAGPARNHPTTAPPGSRPTAHSHPGGTGSGRQGSGPDPHRGPARVDTGASPVLTSPSGAGTFRGHLGRLTGHGAPGLRPGPARPARRRARRPGPRRPRAPRPATGRRLPNPSPGA